jgi:cell division septation protein DedD
MTRMADPERPRDELEDDEQRFEDEGRRSIFSALWFRAILVVVVLGVVAAVAVPYVLELANQPAPKPTLAARPETPPPPSSMAPTSSATPPPPTSAPTDKPPAVEQPPMAEKSTPVPAPMAPEKSATAEKPATTKKTESTATREPATPRQMAASTNVAAAGGAYFVQVGAFKSQDSAKKLATRLRELKYNVEESSMSGAKAERRPAPSPSSSATSMGSDKYDVYVTGGTPADINAKLGPKGLTSEPSAGGVIVKPSLPLRDAVALSKDLAVDGLKVQVRRASGGAPAPAPSIGSSAAASGDAVHRVRVGPFDDRGSATSTLRELEQRGYTPFIARGGQ